MLHTNYLLWAYVHIMIICEHKYSRAMGPLNAGLVRAKIELQVYKYMITGVHGV